jgi:uncharacterized protein
MDAKNASYWIEHLNLLPHPEGGYYREIFSSNEIITQNCLPAGFNGERKLYTSIYFLLEGSNVSHFHRIKSDEIWCFHSGSSLEIHILDIESKHLVKKLGINPIDSEMPQQIVEAGSWFGACLSQPGAYALVACIVAPGFDFNDFELGKEADLLKLYPQHAQIIQKLSL